MSLDDITRSIEHIVRRVRALEVREYASGGTPPGFVPLPADTVITEQAYGQDDDPGISTVYSRGDHTHGTPPAPPPSGDNVSEGPGIDIVSGATEQIGLGGDTILLYDSGGLPVSEFAATSAGLNAALAAATNGDVVQLPVGTIAGVAATVPAGVILSGIDTVGSIVSGTVINNGVLVNMQVVGNVVNNNLCYQMEVYTTAGRGIEQTVLLSGIFKCTVSTYGAATHGIYMTAGRCCFTTVGGDGVGIGIYANGVDVEIDNSRFFGQIGGQIETLRFASNSIFRGGTDYDGLYHSTGAGVVANCTFFTDGGIGYDLHLDAGGLKFSCDRAWDTILGTAFLEFLQDCGAGSAGVPSVGLITDDAYGSTDEAGNVNGMIIQSSIVSFKVGDDVYQVYAYWDSAGHLAFAKRTTNSETWTIYTTAIDLTSADVHRGPSLGIDPHGYLHVAYDLHSEPLKYRRSTATIASFNGTLGAAISMLGTNETEATYPTFFNDPAGKLYFIFRDGLSGGGDLYFYAYDEDTTTWTAATGTAAGGKLIGGKTAVPDVNAYWWMPVFDANYGSGGFMHLFFCWRETPDWNDNFDISYVRWNGTSFTTIAGAAQTIPIMPTNDDVARAIAKNSLFLNSGYCYSDSAGHPHMAYVSGDGTYMQIYHLWHNGASWVNYKLTSTLLVDPPGGDISLYTTKISPPIIVIDRDTDVAYVVFHAEGAGDGLWVYRSLPNDFTSWTRFQVSSLYAGRWQPHYDILEWERNKRLHIPVAVFIDDALTNPVWMVETGPDWVYPEEDIVGVTDHGALTGLLHDDHTQYLLADGTRAGASSQAQSFGANGISTDKITGASGTGVKIGDIAGGNYANISTDGTVTLAGNATTWDDLRISGASARPGSTAPALGAFGPSGGLKVLRFENGHHDEVHFEIQLPHNWKLGSKIYPHVHWTPVSATAGNVVWELEYSWANVGGAFGAPGNMASDATAAGGTAWMHHLTRLKESGNEYIDGTGKELSSMLVCRLHRNAGAGSDTLAADAAFLEFDIHYEIDSLGSAEELSKVPLGHLLMESGDKVLMESGDKVLLEM